MVERRIIKNKGKNQRQKSRDKKAIFFRKKAFF